MPSMGEYRRTLGNQVARYTFTTDTRDLLSCILRGTRGVDVSQLASAQGVLQHKRL